MKIIVPPKSSCCSELSGRVISNEEECLAAVDSLHERGVKIVVVTSGLETSTTKYCYGSVYKGEFFALYRSNEPPLQYRFDIPALPGMFVGTGDVFTSLLLIWMDKLNGDLNLAIQRAIGTLQGLLRRTGQKAYGNVFILLVLFFHSFCLVLASVTVRDRYSNFKENIPLANA
ncbi:unnamed protein product [Gongylonema pulchrum]|uniref:pyridoxal kinase n=1 Tax=Gongylonema pulchrum TaxID=637853 RepID=A0A3P7MD39_9BILA|nr:unnamed protein product [Gongylonema pulchrum]